MKILPFVFVLAFFIFLPRVEAQRKKDKGVFVRVYDYQDQKIAKGYIESIDQESVEVVLRGKRKTLKVSNIKKIRLKRSFGNRIAKGSLIGLSLGAGMALATDISTDDDFSRDLGYVIFPSLGVYGGGIIGGITGIFKKPIEVYINGNREQMQNFIDLLGSNP